MKEIIPTLLQEVSRRDLVMKSRLQSRPRFQKRLNYQVTNFRGVDLEQLFENDYFVFSTPIGNYICTIAFPGVFTELKNVVRSTGGDPTKITLQMVIRALRIAFDATDDVKVRCSCADFCLHPSTQIKLLEGKSLSVEELYKEFLSGRTDLWVYSIDNESHDFRPGHISDVWISGYTDEFIKVTLDNGEVILTTPDHRYMLCDGSYLEAKYLTKGQSLMPLYFQKSCATGGYETVKFNSRPRGYNSVYKEVAKYELQDEVVEAKSRSGEEVISIHHINYNKSDNRPENLKLMGRCEHLKFHSTLLSDRRKSDPEFDRKLREAARRNCYRLNRNPTPALIESRVRSGKINSSKINLDPEKRKYATEKARESKRKWWSQVHLLSEADKLKVLKRFKFTEERRKVLSQSQKRVWASYTEEEKSKRDQDNAIRLNGKNGEKSSKRMRDYWKFLKESQQDVYLERCRISSERLKEKWRSDPQAFAKGRARNVLKFIASNQYEMTEENYFKYKPRNAPRPTKYWSSFSEMVRDLGFGDYNHSVISVEVVKLTDLVPVYDLTVDRYENFLVSAGVVLHNCYRFMYWADRNGYLYGPPTPGTQAPPDIRNPNNSIGSACKHLDLLLSNKQWLVKAASVVNAFIKAYPDKASMYLYDTYSAPIRDDEVEDEYEEDEIEISSPETDRFEVEIDDDDENDDLIGDDLIGEEE